MMILFHGSNVEVEEPKIIISNRTLDFGAGFYTTSDRQQAIKWAKLQTLRRRKGTPTVTVFDLDESKLSQLSVLRFDYADKEWLTYVVENRKGIYHGKKYDMVIGPVADDNTMPIINNYMSDMIDENTALILLKSQKLSDQYAFLTFKSLSCLKLVEVKRYEE